MEKDGFHSCLQCTLSCLKKHRIWSPEDFRACQRCAWDCHLSTRMPFFFKYVSVCMESSYSEPAMEIPDWFVKKHITDSICHVELEASNKKMWIVKLHRGDNYECLLEKGWRFFAESMSICEGNVLFFQITPTRSSNMIRFFVKVFRQDPAPHVVNKQLIQHQRADKHNAQEDNLKLLEVKEIKKFHRQIHVDGDPQNATIYLEHKSAVDQKIQMATLKEKEINTATDMSRQEIRSTKGREELIRLRPRTEGTHVIGQSRMDKRKLVKMPNHNTTKQEQAQNITQCNLELESNDEKESALQLKLLNPSKEIKVVFKRRKVSDLMNDNKCKVYATNKHQSDNNADNNNRHHASLRCSGRAYQNVSAMKRVIDNRYSNADRQQHSQDITFPSFYKLMCSSSMNTNYTLYIPKTFSNQYLKDEPKHFHIRLTLGKHHQKWKAHCTRHSTGSILVSGGWRAFAQSNCVKLWDICIFYMVNKLTFRVRILRTRAKSGHDALQFFNNRVLFPMFGQPCSLPAAKIPLLSSPNGESEMSDSW